jgi:glycerophosphoryl diester phosphodiesterase
MKHVAGLILAASVGALGAADLPAARHAFTVIAHRGNHTRAHENTLAALRAAAEAGIDYVEIDVRRTADGRYVLMHDGTVQRMTDGTGKVSELTLAQLQALKVRDLRRPEIAADSVPTLEEALAVIKGRVHVYLDFKSGDRAEVARILRQAGVIRQILVYDDSAAVPEWRKVAPELPLIVSPPDNLKTPEALVAFAKQLGVEVLDADWALYSAEMVAAAGRAGIKVWPDIQAGEETPDYFTKVLALGFTGVQTDHPEQLLAWLKEHKRR